jgi:WD40 repeat protein
MSAAFDPGGRRVATASSDNTARISDVSTGRTRVVLSGHTQFLTAARFSPDGRFVVTASYDGTARVWDARTGEELIALGEGAPLNDAAFAPDGLRIVTAGLDGKARIYTCEVCSSLGDLMREARGSVTRGLTTAERREFLGD